MVTKKLYGSLVLLVITLLAGCASPPQKKATPEEIMFYAVAAGKLELVERLLNAGLNPNLRDKNNVTPLLYAAEAGYTQVGTALIAKGAR
jgi:ankyrin repeat protein